MTDGDRAEGGGRTDGRPAADDPLVRAHETIRAEVDRVQAELSDLEAEYGDDESTDERYRAHRQRLAALLSVEAQLELLADLVVRELTTRVREVLAPGEFTGESGGDEIVRLCREADADALETLTAELDAYVEVSTGEDEVIEELLGSMDVDIPTERFDEAEVDLASDLLEEGEIDIESALFEEDDTGAESKEPESRDPGDGGER